MGICLSGDALGEEGDEQEESFRKPHYYRSREGPKSLRLTHNNIDI